MLLFHIGSRGTCLTAVRWSRPDFIQVWLEIAFFFVSGLNPGTFALSVCDIPLAAEALPWLWSWYHFIGTKLQDCDCSLELLYSTLKTEFLFFSLNYWSGFPHGDLISSGCFSFSLLHKIIWSPLCSVWCVLAKGLTSPPDCGDWLPSPQRPSEVQLLVTGPQCWLGRCPCFSWDRVIFLPSSWCSAVFCV